MNDNIDKNEIRRAIDRLQTEHPSGIAYDPITFVNMEAVNTINECVDKIARRMMEDTEINIICEFAKLYLEGVKPTIERPRGEWIYKKFDEKTGISESYFCSHCDFPLTGIYNSYCAVCGADMRVKKSNIPKFEWVCPCCGGKEYDANSLCLDCGARMISREVMENECKGN